MNKQDAAKLLEKTFCHQFDIEHFAKFSKELFNIIQIKIEDKSPYIASQYKEYIEKCWKIGEYEDSERKKMEVLAVQLKKTSSRDRARTMQRNFVSTWLGKMDIDGALVAFFGEDPEDWRFSFVKMEYSLVKDEDGKVKIAKELTPAKRYSYLVGINEPNHTCRTQFLDIVVEENVNPTMSAIEQAFSIEKVTKEFFEKYKELVIDVKESLDKILSKDENVKREFDKKGIETIGFSKKTLGQIVFIYFLQKKGWLGVEKQKDGSFNEWGDGPRNFLRKLYKKDIVPYDNFFNDMLEPLFYEALANDRSADNDFYSRFKCKIPFLNGGLFEPINEYDWAGTDVIIPNNVFGKIFDTFDRFNFTVKEDEPLEKEVAVDPEMLGKVFENLLEVKERKDKGAFYTPREIVHYMCQQSLINYLETNTENVPREDLEKFIQYGDFALDQTIRALAQKEVYHGKSFVEEQYLIPQSVAENFETIDILLLKIKIVDPAVGSGAFPVGMMNEIVKARSVLSVYFPSEEQDKRTEYNLKRDCIENCLYGVDIDPSAVEIAKLRFWLSLIVDEMDIKNIKPLPNLDHKIMCGNSLLEEFEGIKLFDEKLLGAPKKDKKSEILEINKEINRYTTLFAQAKTPDDRKKIESQINRLKKKRTDINKRSETEQILLVESESEKKIKQLKVLQNRFFNEQNRNKKKQFRENIDKIEWELIEATLKEQNQEDAMEKLDQYKKTNVKPFFLWKLYFPEIFQRENPGFDVVIANPPYIRVQNLEKAEKEAIKNTYSSATKNFDIYVVFDELGFNIMRNGGSLCYIQPNKFFNSDYGIGLREVIYNNQYLYSIVDFRANQIFSAATTYTCILICRKINNSSFRYVSFTGTNPASEFLRIAKGLRLQDKSTIDETYNPDILQKVQWSFNDSKSNNLFNKIESNGEPLGNFAQKIFQGIITGKDPIYILEKTSYGYYSKHHDEYIEVEENILKPLLKGKEINRYKISDVKYWVIFPYEIHGDRAILHTIEYLKNECPKIWNYLISCESELRKRDKGKMDHHQWYGFSRIQNMAESSSIKIMTQVLAKKAALTIDFKGTYCFVGGGNAGGYGIILKENEELQYQYVLALLNSKLLDFYLQNHSSRFQNGYFSYAKRFIEKIPIVGIKPDKQAPFIELVGKIYTICESDDYLTTKEKQRKVDEIENEIDQMVYKLYALSPPEIEIVENYFRGD